FSPLGIYAQVGLYGLDYGAIPGTSFACPHVVGLAALYASKNRITQQTPNGPQRIITAIERGATQFNGLLNGGFDPQFGYGQIDVASTLLDLDARETTVGGIIGQVTVNDGPIPNVPVVAQRLGSSKKFEVSTFADGIFHLVNLPTGTYTLSAKYLN